MKDFQELIAPLSEPHPVADVLAIVGDHWSLCVLQETFYGITRFADIRNRIDIASNILSNRLARLVKYGLLEQKPYRDANNRTRYEYQLTSSGAELFPALFALVQWGERHLSTNETKILHVACHQEVRVEVRCAFGHEINGVNDLIRA